MFVRPNPPTVPFLYAVHHRPIPAARGLPDWRSSGGNRRREYWRHGARRQGLVCWASSISRARCAEYRPKRGLRYLAMQIHAAKAHDPASPPGPLLDAALSLAQTQLVGQLADETSVDGRTMGTLGFSGALLAADLVAGSVLGPLWWMPLVVLGAATLLCLGPMLGLAADLVCRTDLGPSANVFYRLYREESPQRSREQLLADLDRAFSSNTRRLRAKERVLRLAVVTLAVGLPLSFASTVLL